MEIQTDILNTSSIYAELALKKSQLANIDKQDLFKSTFEKNDSANPISKYDEKDYERVLDKFKSKDAEVKAHEQTHASLGTTTTPISYNYQVGPDGKLYAVGGSVRFDTSIPKDKEEASLKIDKLQKASSSVDDLSRADMAISSAANLNKILLNSMQGFENEN
ncbi:SprA-related family protein [Aliarcobacter thereius]|uniref:SprA-related family protein n=2 Tax=Aliarcobacter thereius TaxID=544718 RepID=A0A1C0B747_9BACT|nr:putative metalloprotease CJM1_0395 family protein [Aliarcobacter thereius]OCL86880.1 SprA-related family protein [Aliarcobacter thereius]OCL91062.1 SprA-related family protein [Aliarcobacter thereius]OCL96084.1 SprA-related family protein [Aliarcobacter thereius LMG 24486]OCL99418.1 SprA-related family protein [Aliarcobacter thereius]QBF15944.1 SprA family protein [Aliarcobacter thereius LMG 24486]